MGGKGRPRDRILKRVCSVVCGELESVDGYNVVPCSPQTPGSEPERAEAHAQPSAACGVAQRSTSLSRDRLVSCARGTGLRSTVDSPTAHIDVGGLGWV